MQPTRDSFLDRDPDSLTVLNSIAEERDRQEDLKAEGRFKYTCADAEMNPFEKYAVLGEEFGEVGRALLEKGELANDKHGVSLEKELIQVAAVAMAWVESIRRVRRAIPLTHTHECASNFGHDMACDCHSPNASPRE